MSRMSISEEIVEELTKQIRERQLKPGDKLPNENSLSQQFNCSRLSVREALKVLSAQGLIVTKHGEGSFVNEYDSEAMAKTLDNLLILSDSAVVETMQLRKIMETEAARLCATNATEEEIQEIEKYMQLREEYSEKNEPQKKYEYDRLFHLAIAKGSHNQLFVNFIETIQQTLMLHQTYSASDETSRHTSMYHAEIVRAILDHDGQRAADMMNAHLTRVQEAMIENMKKS